MKKAFDVLTTNWGMNNEEKYADASYITAPDTIQSNPIDTRWVFRWRHSVKFKCKFAGFSSVIVPSQHPLDDYR
jgi:hypothetical protein